MKRIGINLLYLVPGQVGGTERYARLFIQELERIDQKNQYILFCNKENYFSFVVTSKNVKKVLCPILATHRILRIFYEQFIFPLIIVWNRCNIIHSFGYIGPIFTLAKRIITVHDTNWLDFPQDFTKTTWIVQCILSFFSINTAHLILTDSSFSYQRICHYFPQFKNKIVIIEPWISPLFIRLLMKNSKNGIRQKDYIICVSAMYPHKRIPYLIELYNKWDMKKKYSLILIGKNGKDEEKVKNLVQSSSGIFWRKNISDEELFSLYFEASAAVFPSVYEGYGYPVYESIASGLPTAVGKRSLYNDSISMKLAELTGLIAIDCKTLTKLVQTNKMKIQSRVVTSGKKLIQIYGKI
ncbi:MAG: glycosyltransferase [Candidatus Pacebacteria bacterium]|nr:glycosyltransferase [Candidatus Paceibacterota bacterium]